MKASTLLCGVTLALSVGVAHAAYPDRPVRVIVGFSAGGPTDVIARAFAEQATRSLGQTFVIENKPGANTTLAANAVANAKPDGYTLLLSATNHTMIPALYSDKVGFDALKSFTPVCTLAISPTALVVGTSMPVKTVSEFLQQVKAEPGLHTYATPGTGSSGHFAAAQFLKLTGTSMNHIPYKGAAQAITDLLGGQVDSSFATLGSVLPQLQSGKLHALAVASPNRSAFLPDVPTFEESGVKDYNADAWYGLLAPANTPADVLAALEKVSTEFAKSPETAKKLQSLGMQPQNTCGSAFDRQMTQEVDNYTNMARELGLKSE